MKTIIFTRLLSLLTGKIAGKSITIVFVGDLVLETLQQKYSEWVRKCEMIYIHTDMKQLKIYENYSKLKFLYVGDKTKNSCGKRDFESGVLYAFENKKRILGSLSNTKNGNIIIISTLRYSSACGISTELYKELFQNNTNTYFIGIKPFTFEGVNALTNFNKAYYELNKFNPELVKFIDSNYESDNSDFPANITKKIIELVDKQLLSK